MENRRSTFTLIALIILGIGMIVALTWANYKLAQENPGGNDFLSRWLGTRRFLTRGWSPYSEQTSIAIQEMAYGRPAEAGDDQILFAYPLFSILIFSPYALVGDYALARALWMTTLEALLVIITVLGIRGAKWKPPVWLLTVLLLFSVLWYHGLRPIINGNPSIWVALFILLALLELQAENYGRTGFFLALTMMKPQMVALLVPFILIWAIANRQWTLVVSFFGSLGLLVAGASILIPDWVLQNIRQILAYPSYTLPGTPGAIFAAWLPGIGNQLGWLLTGVLAIVLFVEWRSVLGRGGHGMYWTACLTLVITNLIGIRTATANYVALVPALVLVFAVWDMRWSHAGRWLVFFNILLLMFGLWYLFLATLQPGDQPIQSPVMFFPLPALLLIYLYWVRWWAIDPPILFFDKLKVTNP